MAGSTFGTLFSITTFGESHGEALGVVIDGCPAGLTLTPLDIQAFLDRRKPGQSAISTPRKEADAVQILSGVFEGKTTPSIFSEQDTVNNQREEIKIAIRGRHDPVIVPRAVVVVESMIAITLLDEMMKNMSSRLNDLKTYYAILKDESC